MPQLDNYGVKNLPQTNRHFTTYCVKIYADTNKSLGGTETMTASMRLR